MHFNSLPRSGPLGRVSLVVLLVGSLGALAAAEEPLDLPTLEGYDRASTRDLNNRGRAVGQAFRSDLGLPRQAILWTKTWHKPTTVQALPTLEGFVDSDATAVSRNGKPVGTSSLRSGRFTLFRAVIWKREFGEWRPVELEPPPGYTDAIASDVNSKGQVVGWAFNPGEVINGDVVRSAVVWLPGENGGHTVVELEAPEGFQSTATSINELGDVAGTAYRTEVIDMERILRSDVVVWKRVTRHLWHRRHKNGHPGTETQLVVLPSLPGLPTNRVPTINLFGHVVAAAEVLANGNFLTRPAFWKKRHWRKGGPAYEDPVELAVPEGFTDASAVDINVFGKVVGTASVRDGRRLLASSAVVWKRSHRHGWRPEVRDSPEGATFVSGTRLNDVGKVVGNDIRPPSGSTGALLWERRWWRHKRHR